MKRLENSITDAMGLIENLANEVANDLMGGVEFEEDENFIEWIGSYELDEQILNVFRDELIIDYFEDYLYDMIQKINEENGVEYEIFIEDDCLVVRFANY